MSNSITAISATRISDQFIRQQMLNQVQFGQTQLYQVQMQLATGQQFQVPSEAPAAAQRVMRIQSLLQRKAQMKTSITTNQSYLNQTDSALTNVSNLLTDVRAAAVGVIGSTASDSQRTAVVEQIDQAISEMVDIGNQQFNGRYLFAGSNTSVQPFKLTESGTVAYSGNNGRVLSYVDVTSLFDTNVSGAEALGAISQPVQGANLQPELTYDTRLADLRQGAGVGTGSIAISDGHNTSVIDLRQAATIGDVATLIHNNPPAGRSLNVEVTSTGLTVKLVPDPGFNPAQDNLSVQEVGNGSVANALGILCPNGVGAGPLVGAALDPAVESTTSVDDVLGCRAMGFVHFDGANNDIILEANRRGASLTDGTLLNGVEIRLLDNAPGPGQESAEFDPGVKATDDDPGTPGILTVHISLGTTSPQKIIDAINDAVGIPFTARHDPTDDNGSPPDAIEVIPASTVTAGGDGVEFDRTSGLQITAGDKTFEVSFSEAKTVEDLINAINSSGAGVVAQINDSKTGIDVSSHVSGTSFSIGEAGGKTATQLGLRTFTDSTPLADLNYGRGVGLNTATPGGVDFTIRQADQNVEFDVSLADTQTVGQVCQKINDGAKAAGASLRAQMAQSGNGIELIDDDPSHGTITVTRNTSSLAAIDLGLVPAGADHADSTPAETAGARVNWGPDSGLVFEANDPGSYGNVQIVFQSNSHVAEGDESVSYDSVGKTLTFQIGPDTKAKDIVKVLQDGVSDPGATEAFYVAIDTSSDPTNTGEGLVAPRTVAMTGGKSQSLTGTDVNPQETASVFTALLRLRQALLTNDNSAAQRAMGLLDGSVQNLGNARAELGAREQGLTLIGSRIDAEEIDLKAAMSIDFDADAAQVISDYTGRQYAYEASLRATGQILQMSLLNYL